MDCVLSLNLQEIEIKNQGGQLLSYAFIQFDNIKSVVTALHDMDGEHVSGSKIKVCVLELYHVYAEMQCVMQPGNNVQLSHLVM